MSDPSENWSNILRLHRERGGIGSVEPRSRTEPARAAIVLAGGSGRRLAGYLREQHGTDLPKQFCALWAGPTLLQQTLERTRHVVRGARTFVSVCAGHEATATSQLASSEARLVVQPRDCGTALGLLLPLVDALIDQPDASVLFTPADHGFLDVAPLVRALERAFDTVAENAASIVLLGSEADHAASDYGWIVPAERRGTSRRVEAFVEKPPAAVAQKLYARGCLWSTMIGVARGRELFALFERAVPEVVRSLVFHAGHPADAQPTLLRRAYSRLASVDFSSGLLAKADLAVVEIPREAGWTDLGTPARVALWLGTSAAPPQAKHSEVRLRAGEEGHDEVGSK